MAEEYGRRVPPHSVEAEMSVLGCMLLDQEKIATVIELVRVEDFYRDEHREVFLAALSLFEKSKPVDVLTAADELRARGRLAAVGGTAFLGELVSCVPTPENARHYAGIVADKAVLRKVIAACQKVMADGYEAAGDAEGIVESAEEAIFRILEDRNRSGVTHVREIIAEIQGKLRELYNSRGRITGAPTGFAMLDDKTFGLHNSDLILLAARPSVGKSAFALNIAHHIAVYEKLPVIIFSLEMSRDQCVSRMISADEKIDFGRMKSGRLSDDDWVRFAAASGRLMESPLYIDDTAGVTAVDIKAKCRRLKLEKGLGLVVIDYLQLMMSAARGRGDNRQLEISEISRSLKLMAKELDVPVLALSQLSRAPEQRHDHTPMLSDLRDSGAIEQDADIVLFLYRDEMYNQDTEKPGVASLIIAKHRNGETGKIDFNWMGNFQKFGELDKRYGDMW